MFPDDVKTMAALDPELSAAPLTVKIKFCKQNPGTFWKLQLRRKSSPSGNPTPKVSSSTDWTIQGQLQTTGQQPLQSSSATAHPPPSSSPMLPVPSPPPGFLNR